VVVGFQLLDTVIHTWDMATALGTKFRPDDELVDATLSQARLVPGAPVVPGGSGRRVRPCIAVRRRRPLGGIVGAAGANRYGRTRLNSAVVTDVPAPGQLVHRGGDPQQRSTGRESQEDLDCARAAADRNEPAATDEISKAEVRPMNASILSPFVLRRIWKSPITSARLAAMA